MPLQFMHADHIGSAGGYEPQRSNNGLIWFTDPNGSMGRDEIRLSTQGFPLPKRNIGPIEFGYLNEKRKFPGMPNYDDMQLIFKDYCDQETALLIEDWYHRVHNPRTGQTGFARDYKLRGWCSLYSPDGSIERRYVIQGCWPNAFDPGDVDHDGEDIVRINLTLSVEKAFLADPYFTEAA